MHFSATSSLSSSGAATAIAAVGATNGAALEITGRVASENEHVQMNSFHTLMIEVNRNVSIQKEEWDSFAISRVEEASVEGRGAEVGALVLGEGKSAHSWHRVNHLIVTPQVLQRCVSFPST